MYVQVVVLHTFTEAHQEHGGYTITFRVQLGKRYQNCTKEDPSSLCVLEVGRVFLIVIFNYNFTRAGCC